MLADRFKEALNTQIGYEMAAEHQYVAAAIYYDDQTLPRLASFFYEQAKEERTHAMMMVQFLLDVGVRPHVPAVDAPQHEFADFVAPVQLALQQEKDVGEQISQLVGIARDERDYLSEQFVQWFLKEQIEEVALMSSLLDVCERAAGQPLLVEDYLAREGRGNESDPTAPPAAGEA